MLCVSSGLVDEVNEWYEIVGVVYAILTFVVAVYMVYSKTCSERILTRYQWISLTTLLVINIFAALYLILYNEKFFYNCFRL